MSAKRQACQNCGAEALIETIKRNNGICEACKRLQKQLEEDPALAERLSGDPEDEDLTPHPRTPPKRSFDSLPSTNLPLNANQYARVVRSSLRYDSYDLLAERNSPAWDDEEIFYQWLVGQAGVPRELAEMLYYHAPEVSFDASILLNGVADIIETNSDEGFEDLRCAGFFVIGSCCNGDLLVVSLESGKAGYLPLETFWGQSPQQLKEMFIPVSGTIGDLVAAFEDEECDLPRDYWSAYERYRK